MPTATSDDAPRGLMDEDGRAQETIALGSSPPPQAGPTWNMLARVGSAMAVVAASVVAVYVVPGLEDYRPWRSGDPRPFWNVSERPFAEAPSAEQQAHTAAVDAVAQEVLDAPEPEPPIQPAPKPAVAAVQGKTLAPFEPGPQDGQEVVQPLLLPSGHELDRFFESLARTDAGIQGAVTHVVHWGDSAIGVDGIPMAIRRRMQNRFGDAGHGFHLMAPPNSSYRHREVDFSTNGGWRHCFIIQKCRSDGHYGLGGATFRSSGGGQSTFAPHPKHSSGRVGRFEVHYAAQPGGGRLSLRVDDGETQTIETEAEALEDRFVSLPVDDGPHELRVRAAGEGKVRVYGVSMEREGPGVVWDGLALVGAFTRRMLEYDEAHLRGQLAQRQADLVVLTFGGNDMVRKIKMSSYAEEYRQVVQLVRKARPTMDCLIMSPLDHGERKGQRIVSRAVVPRMVAAMADVAKTEGCAFFDTFAAMGGEGAAGRWYHRKPRLISGDLGHATARGHQVIGELFFRALVQQYVAFRRARDQAGGIAAVKP